MRLLAIKRKCPQCGKTFETTASRKIYCSDECLRKADNAAKRRKRLVASAITSKKSAREALSNEQYLSISQASRFLCVSRPTIYKYIQKGILVPVRKSEAVVRIPVEQLKENLELTKQLPDINLSNAVKKAEVIEKFQISETWFHRVLKKNKVTSIRIGAISYYDGDLIERLFTPKEKTDYSYIKEWYTSDELAIKEGVTRKHICATAHKLGIPVKRSKTTCYIAKSEWDNKKISQTILDSKYMTIQQAKAHYHIGNTTFYEKVNAAEITKVQKGRFTYFPIRELDVLFKNKEPYIPKEIKLNYIRSNDALKLYHVGQKRFSEETRAAGIEKIRTEGNFVWYRKDQLDELFK